MTPRREARLALLLGAAAAVLSLWLLFDPRYRDFFPAGFLPPALLLLLSSRCAPVIQQGRQELAIGSLLGASAIIIAGSEGFANLQALAWSATTLLLGAALLWRGAGKRRQISGGAPRCAAPQAGQR